MDDDTLELDNHDLGGTEQDDDPAGGAPTGEMESAGMDDPTNGDDDDDGDDDTSDSDETRPDELARVRDQAARYRRRLRDAEAALWSERVAALGILADPDDLPYDADALHDPDRLRELADELVERKPHLRSRRIRERAGQGEGSGADGVNLAALLARGA